MLRNKVGIKKMMTAGELGAFISHVRYSITMYAYKYALAIKKNRAFRMGLYGMHK